MTLLCKGDKDQLEDLIEGLTDALGGVGVTITPTIMNEQPAVPKEIEVAGRKYVIADDEDVPADIEASLKVTISRTALPGLLGTWMDEAIENTDLVVTMPETVSFETK